MKKIRLLLALVSTTQAFIYCSDPEPDFSAKNVDLYIEKTPEGTEATLIIVDPHSKAPRKVAKAIKKTVKDPKKVTKKAAKETKKVATKAAKLPKKATKGVVKVFKKLKLF